MKRARDSQLEGGAPSAKSGEKKKKAKVPPKPSVAPSASHGASGFFKGYDLSIIPKEAWPQNVDNKGAHGYTIKSRNGSVLWL